MKDIMNFKIIKYNLIYLKKLEEKSFILSIELIKILTYICKIPFILDKVLDL